jgi:aspartyl/asparaginyl-tRNA synthetase
MIEPEIAFADLAEDADVAEAYIKYVVRYAMETCPGDVAFFEALEEKTKKEEAAEAAKEAMAAAKAAKDAAKAAQAKAAAEKKAAAEAAKAAAAADPAAAAAAAVATAPEKKKKEEKKAAPAATTAAPVDWKVGRTLRQRLQETLDTPFKRLTYTEAIDILVKDQAEGKVVFKESDIHWGIDLASEHERYLAEVVFKKPLVLMNYPKDIKAFYMRLNDDGKTVAAMDILVPGVRYFFLIFLKNKSKQTIAYDMNLTEIIGLTV